jgi:polar amino acid transport system substrate-binding protein
MRVDSGPAVHSKSVRSVRLRLIWLLLALVCWGLGWRLIRNTWFYARTDPTWEHIQRQGVVRACMDAAYPPFEVQDSSGSFAGYDVDLARELAARWGVRAEFVNVHFDGLYDALLAGKCDVLLSALPYDENMTEDVLFSPSYFNAGLLLAVREGETRIRSVNTLSGTRVAVETGASAHLEARRLQEQARISLEIVPLPTAREALQAVVSLEVDAAIADSVAVYEFAADPGGIRYSERFLTDEQYVIAMRPDSGYLWKRIADELARMDKDGFLEDLQSRWFSQAMPGG